MVPHTRTTRTLVPSFSKKVLDLRVAVLIVVGTPSIVFMPLGLSWM
jgi:hypothetical protein